MFEYRWGDERQLQAGLGRCWPYGARCRDRQHCGWGDRGELRGCGRRHRAAATTSARSDEHGAAWGERLGCGRADVERVDGNVDGEPDLLHLPVEGLQHLG